jgi:O-succinylbenzoic acid--CoA ligase
MDRVKLAHLLGATGRLAEPPAGPAVIEETDPERFRQAFAHAVSGGGPVFLADPAWGARERGQLAALLEAPIPGPQPLGSRGWLMIPSGGTGGTLKFARHDEETIAAAVLGFSQAYGVRQINAVGVLPLHHVSGLMAWMRCVLTGGEYLPWDWKQLEAGRAPSLAGSGDWFLSVVPTQLQRLLALPDMVAWLRRFRVIWVGGGPVWPELAEAAARAELPLALSYGMTETAAMVAGQRPGDFLAGQRDCGPVLPHARIGLNEEGLVEVTGASVFRGYWPEWRDERSFATEDLGQLDEQGRLRILGRRDAMIITGGKKVSPSEVEAALRATGQFTDVAVIGMPDREWGEIIVACYPAAGKTPDFGQVVSKLGALIGYKRPKSYLAIDPWPRNAQGKINRAALLGAASRSTAQDPS